MYNTHLNLFIFRRSPKFVEERNLLLARTINQCVLGVVSSLDSAKPIPSQGDQFKVPHTTTRISKNVDCGHPIPHFLPASTAKALFAVSQCTYTYRDVTERPRFIPLSSPFGWRVRGAMSTTSSLSAYLLEQKTRFLADNGDGWTVVMGNEAGGTPTPVAFESLQS